MGAAAGCIGVLGVRGERPFFIRLLDKVSYPAGTAVHYQLSMRLGDYEAVLLEKPSEFYRVFSQIVGGEKVMVGFFKLLLRYLEERRGVVVSAEELIRAMREDNRDYVRLVMGLLEKTAAEILSEGK